MFPVSDVQDSLIEDRVCKGKLGRLDRYVKAADHGKPFFRWSGQGDFSHLGKNEKWSLYNLRTDVGEKEDCSKQCPEIRKRLEKLLSQTRTDLGDRATRGTDARPLGKVSEAEGKRLGRKYRGL